ncbi:MAG: alpha/beta fold hydrolase, partial [Shimia sp.]
DMRGHGASDVPPPPYRMGQLVSDAEAVLDGLGLRDVLFVGLSLGGMVGQGLAVKRLDLVRAMVLANTGAKIATPAIWEARAEAIRQSGMGAVVDQVLERWFSPGFRRGADLAPWRRMVLDMAPDGYRGGCAAIAGTDFYTPTAGLRLPVLGIAGGEDASTPVDLVRETVGLIPGARTELLRGAGHVSAVEQPEAFAALVAQFAREVGHIR